MHVSAPSSTSPMPASNPSHDHSVEARVSSISERETLVAMIVCSFHKPLDILGKNSSCESFPLNNMSFVYLDGISSLVVGPLSGDGEPRSRDGGN